MKIPYRIALFVVAVVLGFMLQVRVQHKDASPAKVASKSVEVSFEAEALACQCGGRGQSCSGGLTCCLITGGCGNCYDLNTSIVNCGSCGCRCSGYNLSSWTCVAGACVDSCNAGFADCNADINVCNGDGCETEIDNDTSNCGGCGTVCSSGHITTPTCSGSVCNGTCDAGYGDCNSNKQSDGCETQTNGTDVNNCGACGTVCSASHITQTCTAGVCNGTCDTGYTDCDGNKQSNGCEVNTGGDASNCGACGHVCGYTSSAGFACNAGVCQCGGVTCGKDQNCVGGVCQCTATHPHCAGTPATECDRASSRLDPDMDTLLYECSGNPGACAGGCGGGGICCPNGGGGTSCIGYTTNTDCFGCGNACNTVGGYTCQTGAGKDCCYKNGVGCQVPPPA